MSKPIATKYKILDHVEKTVDNFQKRLGLSLPPGQLLSNEQECKDIMDSEIARLKKELTAYLIQML